MLVSRRKLIGGIGLLFAAPAIVRASSLMPVKAVDHAEWAGIMPRFVAPELEPSFWLVQWGESTVTTMRGPAMIQALGLEGYTPHLAKEFRLVDSISPTAAGESAA